MARIVSHNSHDFLPIEIVDAIAAFDGHGNVRPLYVRINGENYKISSFKVRKNYANQMEYQCKLIVNDCLQPLTITYYMKEGIWTIPKEWDR